MSGVSVTIKKK
jgi:hypothetical protein